MPKSSARSDKASPSELPAYMSAPESGADEVPRSRQEVLSKQLPRRHVISLVVKNVPGLLAQVANLFAARGYNIESLTVAETENMRFSRMTLVVRGAEMIIEALKKNLSKFVNVIKVLDFSGMDYVERDLALVKIATPAGARQEIFQLVEVFEGQIVDIGLKDCMVEIIGPEKKIDAFLRVMSTFGIKEMARTGRVALARGSEMAGHLDEYRI
ncbi:MAG: acetolactate synthase small subunit [Planctomycetota bacterium]|nr:acetolactate synthase small subunit [Planctomycetota bacterium]